MRGGTVRSALLCAMTASLLAVSGVGANPPGVPAGAKKVYQFSLIGHPGVYNGGCGEGNRLFVSRDSNRSRILVVDQNDGWYVSTCNATGSNTGGLHSDLVGAFAVYARILGKPGGEVSVCADALVEDPQTREMLCLLGAFQMKRETGKSQFTLAPAAIFDASLPDILWNVTTDDDFRIAQFRVYRVG